jgi:hypothetical protein
VDGGSNRYLSGNFRRRQEILDKQIGVRKGVPPFGRKYQFHLGLCCAIFNLKGFKIQAPLILTKTKIVLFADAIYIRTLQISWR